MYTTAVKQIAISAGEKILEFYGQNVHENKSDGSPLTKADLAANKIIVEGLKNLPGSFPILSEEIKDDLSRLNHDTIWIIDPLDGTKEFLEGREEFTVNIALVRKGKPILGVIYCPVSKDIYYADEYTAHKNSSRISCSDIKLNKMAISRSHASKNFQDFFPGIEPIISGSSLKGCLVAEGLVDFYAREGPLCEWDIAAMHRIVESAGGVMLRFNGEPIEYNQRKTLIEGGFFATSKNSLNYLTEKKWN